MALSGSHHAPVALPFAGLRARLAALLSGDAHFIQRVAGTAFIIRVASAAVAYGSQVLLARWMGRDEFGVYVYVWTWLLLIGTAIDLGLASSAQRFIPEYLERKADALLRGFISSSRWVALGMAVIVSALAALAVHQLGPWLGNDTIMPLYLACAALPAYALGNIQDGIARSFDWFTLALAPSFIIRQLLLVAFAAAAYAAGLPIDAVTGMGIAAIAIWGSTLGQLVVLSRRLKPRLPAGPKAFDLPVWFKTALPILIVESFFLLLTYIDVLVLQQYRPPAEIAVYYAAAKTLALVSFIHWSVSATAAHRFSALHVAGLHDELAAFLTQTIRWTFWPSLAATGLLLLVGRPILELFGAGFADGYPLLVILAVGLLARAAIGPIERLLNMLGEQRICALVYGVAFASNLALCLILIPPYGATGAAVATTTAFAAETVMLFLVTRKRLGLDVSFWRRSAS